MRAMNLKTEHMTNPIGIDIREPYLSWTCEDGIKQSAYEIEVKEDNQVVWNSGKVYSDCMHITYGGHTKSRQRLSWRIRLWDEKDEVGEWSQDATF